MRKFLSLVLALVMALSLCAPAWAAEGAEASKWDGVVPADMPATLVVDGDTQTVHVKDAAAFAYLSTLSAKWAEFYTDGEGREYSNYHNGAGAKYYYSGDWTVSLEADLDLANYPIEPVVIMFGEATGASTFNGNGHVIRNINTTTGLFATRTRASFSDFTLFNVKATSGALTDFAEFPVTNVTVKNATISGTDYVGGLIGKTYSSVTGCKVIDSSVVATGKEAGGLIGYAEANSKGSTIANNTVENVTVFANNRAAGLVAQVNINIKVYDNTVDSVTVGAEDESKYEADYVVSNALAPENVYDNTVKFSVSFDANGGNGVLTQDSVPVGTFILPTEHPFTREGYTFVGWATDKDATKVLGTTYNVTGAVTFYAIWEKEECTSDSHVEIVVEYSGDVATKVYCDYCKVNFAFIQGTEDDAKDKFGEGNYVNAENDVWYTLKAQSGEVPSVPEIPPVEDDKTEGEKVAVTTPAEVDTVVNNTVIDAVKDSAETTVTVTTPVEGDADAETTIKFDSSDAKDAFVNATATDITTALTAVEAPVTDEVTAKVEEKVGDDAELAAYLDIDITVFADGDPVGEITQLPKEIKVVIPASALDFGDLEKNHTRKVSVIRFHDDQVDVIPAKLEADGSVSFYSHLFSTYAVVYEDVATSTNYPIYYWPVGDTTTTDEDVTSPKTFDAGVALYVGMSVAAAVGTVTLSKKRED